MGRQVGDNGRSKASGKARAAVKGAQILELVASGHTVTHASRVVGVSQHYASQLYQRELQAAMERNDDLRQGLLAQDLETLRLLIQAHMPAAVGRMIAIDADGYEVNDDGEGHVDLREIMIRPPDHQSAKIVISALDRRAKLLGLDAEIKVRVSSSRVNEAIDDIEDMIDEAEDHELAEVLELDARRLTS
jgi:hypothetical protein